MKTIAQQELKQLLKEAFDAGRDYQYTINPYNGKPLNDKYPSFTKWYNKKTKSLLTSFNESIKCHCGSKFDGIECYSCGFDATEIDIY